MKTRGMRWMALAASLCSLAVLSGTLAVPALAQSTAGSIYGTVADTSGAVIPDATVTVKNVQNGDTHAVQSNASGDYVFSVLEPGSYTVSAQMKGFRVEVQTGIRLDANQNIHASFALRAGATSETVTISAATTMVDTLESQLGSTIDERQLEELPLNGRDAYDLVQLSPGITNFKEDQSAQYSGDVVGTTFSSNGLRTYNNSYYLDGALDESLFRQGGDYAPNPDALLEFRLLTSNFDSEFGSYPGGVVNMITRSGTNNFHGGVYEYLRNNIWNAHSQFLTNVPHLRYNQFGGNVGGPVYHNKLFFFFSYQGLRLATNSEIASTAVIVPTMAERQGNFTADTKPPVCGANSYPCGGTPGMIPTGLLDPVVQNLMKIIPLPSPSSPTLASGGYAPQQTANAPVSENQYMTREDYQLTEKHRLSIMFFYQHGSTASPTSGSNDVIGYSGDALTDFQTNLIGTDTWTISPNMLNTVRLYFTGNNYFAADMFAGKFSLADLGGTAPPGGSPTTSPEVSVPGFFQMGNDESAPDNYWFETYGGGDTFNWTHGSHTLKFGATLQRNRYFENNVTFRGGEYDMTGWASGSYLGDLMLGKTGTFSQTNGLEFNFHMWNPALFIQDDWKVARRLTLNLGLRWEVFQPLHGDNNTLGFAPNVQSQRYPSFPTGLLVSGDPGVPDGVVQTPYKTFAPRVGFAYDVFGNGKTGIRGGWGLFYSGVSGGYTGASLSPNFSQSVSITDATSFSNPYAGSTTPVDPFPFTPNLTNPTVPPGTTFETFSPYDHYVPYVMEYNLTLEQQLSTQWGARVSYVGNGARRFIANRDENAPIYSSTCTAATCGSAAEELARRPYKPTTTTYVFGKITELDPETISSYNALQLTLTRSFAHHFTLNANYVWMKDMSDGVDPTSGNTTISATSSYNFMQDYGKSTLDIPQHLVASYTWVSPDIHIWGYVGKEALSGWQLNGITTFSTGSPFNVTSGSDTNYDGNNDDRPDVVSNPSLGNGASRAQKIAGYFNKAAFASVPVGTATGAGDEQFDMLIGPGIMNTDFSAFKDFPIVKENKLQFRGEIFNLFNNINLANPTTTMTSSAFGKISGESTGNRVVQFALKYSF